MFKTFVPADLGVWLARLTSTKSRSLVTINRKEWFNEYAAFAKEKFTEGYDVVILGHLHYPKKNESNGKLFFCCGDFIKHFTYVELSGDILLLKYLT